jgi:hypothetical protein
MNNYRERSFGHSFTNEALCPCERGWENNRLFVFRNALHLTSNERFRSPRISLRHQRNYLLLCSLLFNLAGQSLNHGPRSPDHGPSRGKHVSGGVMKPYPRLICDPGEHAQRG